MGPMSTELNWSQCYEQVIFPSDHDMIGLRNENFINHNLCFKSSVNIILAIFEQLSYGQRDLCVKTGLEAIVQSN